MLEHQNTACNRALQREHPIATLLLTFARFPLAASERAAHSIAAHLQLVANDARVAEPVRQAASQACSEWRAMMQTQAEVERLRLRTTRRTGQ